MTKKSAKNQEQTGNRRRADMVFMPFEIPRNFNNPPHISKGKENNQTNAGLTQLSVMH